MILQVSSSRGVPVCHQARGAAMLPEIGRTVEHGYLTVAGTAGNQDNRAWDLVKRMDHQVWVSRTSLRARCATLSKEVRKPRSWPDLTWKAQELHGGLPASKISYGACLMSASLGPQRSGQFPNDIILKAKVINFIIRIVCWPTCCCR